MDPLETDLIAFADRASALEQRAIALGAPVQQSLPLLPAALPVSVDHAIDLSLAFDRLGARDEYLQARELVVDLLRLHRARDPLEFANAAGIWAAALAEAGRPGDAVVPLRECVTLLAPCAAPEINTDRLATDREALDGLALYARALLDLGGCLGELGQLQDGIQIRQQALAAYERCAAASSGFEGNVAITCIRLADMLLEQTDTATDALSAADRAVGVLGPMADFAPYRDAALPDLAYAQWLRTRALTRLDRLDDAVAAGRQSVDLLRIAASSSVPHLGTLVTALELTSDLLADAKEHDEALALAAEALEAADRTENSFLQLMALWLHSRRILDHPGETEDWDDSTVDGLLSAYAAIVEHAPAPWLEELAVQLMTLHGRLADLTRVGDAATAVALALTPYRQLAAADPDWTPPYCHALGVYAELCLRIGAQDEALTIAEHHLSVASAHDHVSAVHARAQETLATCLASVGRAEEAEQASRAAVGLWIALADAGDDDPDVPGGLAHAWNTLANRLLGVDRPEEAAAAAARAAALWPADNIGRGSALYLVGVALARLNRHRQAADNFREAVAVYDGHAPLAPHQETQLSDVLHNLAVSHGRLSENDEAFACASRAAAILHRQWQADPVSHHAHLLRALVTLMHCGAQADELTTAAEAARLRVTVLETHPGTEPLQLGMALGDLGGLQLNIGAAQDAIESFTRSAKAVPEDPHARAMIHCRGALALHRCGRTKDAIHLARHAIDLLGPIENETDHPYLLWLAQLHHDLAVYLLADARPLEALGAVGRAVPLRERLAETDPGMHTASLISDLELTATLFYALDRPDQAQRTRARIKDLTR
ncbi:hypothetical protein ACFV3E_34105 [Streptomyces sp. NPDC059718]